MRLVSLLVYSLQWLAVAASPTLLGLFSGVYSLVNLTRSPLLLGEV
ncbi:hypothetical protein K0I73_16715 [Shewanella mesophila]|nr:hypothetical protein [Shewanella mesophila]QYJ85793.1 hypothetical protein K0I73_16715 [Shewanella mesophila]